MPQRIVLLCSLIASACSTPPEGLLDFCDGLDDDGDGTIDEGVGAAVDCRDYQVCVNGVCTANCGDHLCTTANGENCGLCPADCGECPRCGDGTCNGSDTCSSCAADCGACPFCGDGRCNNGETCSTCGDDCGLCAGECEPCSASFTCASGQTCRQRICDGAIGCYLDSPARGCEEVDGEPCPPVTAYDRCTADEDCGPLLLCDMTTMRCTGLPAVSTSGPGVSACDGVYEGVCPPPPNGIAGLEERCRAEVCEGCFGCSSQPPCPYRCELTCTDTCPYGMVCPPCVESPCSPRVCRNP